MHSCDFFQAEMLNNLYGLLDTAEATALADHVAGCPACQAALTRARRQQELLAAAAKSAFPAVTFQPPPSPASAPTVTPARGLLGGHWRRWAVAAAILAAIVLLPTGWA